MSKRKNKKSNKNGDKANFDPAGSYTGVPNEVFYNNVTEEPVQDADDL